MKIRETPLFLEREESTSAVVMEMDPASYGGGNPWLCKTEDIAESPKRKVASPECMY